MALLPFATPLLFTNAKRLLVTAHAIIGKRRLFPEPIDQNQCFVQLDRNVDQALLIGNLQGVSNLLLKYLRNFNIIHFALEDHLIEPPRLSVSAEMIVATDPRCP